MAATRAASYGVDFNNRPLATARTLPRRSPLSSPLRVDHTPRMALGMALGDKHPGAKVEDCTIKVRDRHTILVGSKISDGALRWVMTLKLSRSDDKPGDWHTDDEYETAPAVATTQ